MYNLKPVILKTEINRQGKVNIKIRLTVDRKPRYIKTEWWITPEEWDAAAGCMKPSRNNPTARQINRMLPGRMAQIEDRLAELGRFQEMSVKQIMAYARGEVQQSQDFFEYTRIYIEMLKSLPGEKTTWEKYQSTLSAMKAFHPFSTLEFRDINVRWLREFEMNELGKPRSINTVALHNRNIRAQFNRAITEEIIDRRLYPFNDFKIRREKGKKKVLTLEEMRRLHDVKLDGNAAIARDFFFLSFYMIGTNIKDLLFLTEAENGRVEFKRFKTNRQYSIHVPDEAWEIINQYRGKKHFLRFNEHYASYRNFTKWINGWLHRIAAMEEVGISKSLTTYYARYTWATVARKLGVSKDTIAFAMGHGEETITDGYIEEDFEVMDEANQRVIEWLTKAS